MSDETKPLSAEYLKALEINDAAIMRFDEIRHKYRSGLIGDKEYLAERKKWEAAASEFDKAWMKESETEA